MIAARDSVHDSTVQRALKVMSKTDCETPSPIRLQEIALNQDGRQIPPTCLRLIRDLASTSAIFSANAESQSR
jgi:hypothetical protein